MDDSRYQSISFNVGYFVKVKWLLTLVVSNQLCVFLKQVTNDRNYITIDI